MRATHGLSAGPQRAVQDVPPVSERERHRPAFTYPMASSGISARCTCEECQTP